MQPEKSCIEAGSLSTALGLTVDNLRTPPRKKLELTSRATAVPGDTTLTGGFPSRLRDAFLAFRLTVTLCHVSRITVELLLASPTPLPRSYLNLTNLTTKKKEFTRIWINQMFWILLTKPRLFFFRFGSDFYSSDVLNRDATTGKIDTFIFNTLLCVYM